MTTDPWTDPDPQPGDLDDELAKLDPRYVEVIEGEAEAKLIVLVGVEGEDAKRLERLAETRGKTAADVVAEAAPRRLTRLTRAQSCGMTQAPSALRDMRPSVAPHIGACAN
jgi:hypothetical protein